MPPRPCHFAMLAAVLLLALAVIAPHAVQGASNNIHEFVHKRCHFVASHTLPQKEEELLWTLAYNKCKKTCRDYAFDVTGDGPHEDYCGVDSEEVNNDGVVKKACGSTCRHPHSCKVCMAKIWNYKRPAAIRQAT